MKKNYGICLFCLIISSLMAMRLAAQVSIQNGAGSIDESAMLDIGVADKGVLIPQVSLTSVYADLDGIAGQAAGLLVFNTGGSLAQGFYFWDGTEWLQVNATASVTPHISGLLCANATIEPQVFIANIPYTGILKVPYQGGNGGRYLAGTSLIHSIGNTGLKAQLRAGKLASGEGYLVYDVVGTPAYGSPREAGFTVDFDAKNCTLQVGKAEIAAERTAASIGPLGDTAGGYHRVITSPDGKFSVRVFVDGKTRLRDATIHIRSNGEQRTIMFNGQYAWDGDLSAKAGNALILNKDQWSAYWGEEHVYTNDRPQQRSYMWTSTDVHDKTMYHLTFMLGAPKPDLNGQTGHSQTKAFFRIIQTYAQ
jgi:hypothetical protein